MANGTKELHTSPITIEDEINEFSEKPVMGKTLYKKLKELEDGTLPDTSGVPVGTALSIDLDGDPIWSGSAVPKENGEHDKIFFYTGGTSKVAGWSDIRELRKNVLFTPTALDYSGTMSETQAEISRWLELGYEVWCSIDKGGGFVSAPITATFSSSGMEYNGFSISVIDVSQDIIIVASVDPTNSGTNTEYLTKIYSLTSFTPTN